MADFENGVASYITGYAIVKNHFPVDAKGKAEICCRQCRFFRYSSNSCALNGEICNYPERYVGLYCPLAGSIADSIEKAEKAMEEDNG